MNFIFDIFTSVPSPTDTIVAERRLLSKNDISPMNMSDGVSMDMNLLSTYTANFPDEM